MKKIFLAGICVMLLAGCSASPETVQTAIAQTQAAILNLTPTVDPQIQIQTAIAETQALTASAESLAATVESRIQTSVASTLTALPPAATSTPAATATPEATATMTYLPHPTITNTPEPFVPSGPITLLKVENQGNHTVKLTWEAEGSFLDGFYVVWSASNAEPNFNTDYWYYFSNGKLRSAIVDVKQSNVFNFRICEYKRSSQTCENYSNVITIAVN